ncbi:MAG: PEP-CTERM sorting domain-containing protein [Nitrospira sp.]|nr:PEP-CTERM sorting domain-containing protein [Nitrospira sp.]MBH0183102.1 PEP-CTERM sorting domain-containing protein [Nitrospira sp.]MBH0186236.1 PEP-CTERM sorting domain-containing protein [Nitrospira sp.]
MKQLILSLVLGVAAIGILLPQQASAVPTLMLSDGITTHTVVLSDGAATDQSTEPGVVVFNGAIGSWSVNVTTGIVLNEGRPYMDLNSINVSSTSASSTTLSIYFSETGFTTDNGFWEAAIGGTARNSIQYSTYLGTSNNLFDTSTGLTNSGPLGSGAFSSTLTSLNIVTGPYSLTQYVQIQHGAGTRSTSFNAELRSVPEPSALLLMGLGFLGLALWRRREAQN